MMVHGRSSAGADSPQQRAGEITQLTEAQGSRIGVIRTLLDLKINPALPWYSSKVQAGFPSPADDYIERYLDLNAHYIKHPAATFFVTATGDSMENVGIYSGDVLMVDKSLEAVDGAIVIAAVNGELTVKRLSRQSGRVQLLAANAKYPPIDISEEQELVIWGVVTLVLHVPV